MQILNIPSLRRVRSFVRREGRMTKTQSQAWETLWSQYGLSIVGENTLDLNRIFRRPADKIVEIGFGDGSSLVQMAADALHKDFLGIDVYRTGVGSLLAKIKHYKLSNIRIICQDAVEVLEQNLQDNDLMGVQIFFPDPWPKLRHHKRRLIQPYFVDLLARKLKENGTLHLCTDWMDYAYYMMMILSADNRFSNIAGLGQFLPRPHFRPATKYEHRGLQLGHQTWDLIFRRVVI